MEPQGVSEITVNTMRNGFTAYAHFFQAALLNETSRKFIDERQFRLSAEMATLLCDSYKQIRHVLRSDAPATLAKGEFGWNCFPFTNEDDSYLDYVPALLVGEGRVFLAASLATPPPLAPTIGDIDQAYIGTTDDLFRALDSFWSEQKPTSEDIQEVVDMFEHQTRIEEDVEEEDTQTLSESTAIPYEEACKHEKITELDSSDAHTDDTWLESSVSALSLAESDDDTEGMYEQLTQKICKIQQPALNDEYVKEALKKVYADFSPAAKVDDERINEFIEARDELMKRISFDPSRKDLEAWKEDMNSWATRFSDTVKALVSPDAHDSITKRTDELIAHIVSINNSKGKGNASSHEHALQRLTIALNLLEAEINIALLSGPESIDDPEAVVFRVDSELVSIIERLRLRLPELKTDLDRRSYALLVTFILHQGREDSSRAHTTLEDPEENFAWFVENAKFIRGPEPQTKPKTEQTDGSDE